MPLLLPCPPAFVRLPVNLATSRDSRLAYLVPAPDGLAGCHVVVASSGPAKPELGDTLCFARCEGESTLVNHVKISLAIIANLALVLQVWHTLCPALQHC